MQFTTSRFLLALTAFSICLVGLLKGGVIAIVVIAVTLFLVLTFLVLAIVGQDQRQVFALGFTITVSTYGTILGCCGHSEFDPYQCEFITSRALYNGYVHIRRDACFTENGDFVGYYSAEIVKISEDSRASLARENRDFHYLLAFALYRLRQGFKHKKKAIPYLE